MPDILALVTSPRLLLFALVAFALVPSLVARLIVACYPKTHPRRRELIAELHVVPRWERPFWVLDHVVFSVSEGIGARRVARRQRKAAEPLRLTAEHYLGVLLGNDYWETIAQYDRRLAEAQGATPFPDLSADLLEGMLFRIREARRRLRPDADDRERETIAFLTDVIAAKRAEESRSANTR